MSALALAMVVLLGLLATIALALPERDDDPEFTGAERILVWAFGFFGVGDLPIHLALAVLFSTSAVAMAALDLIANLYFGPAYPGWFPVLALASGVCIGLLSTRILTACRPRHESTGSDTPYVGLP